MNDNLNSIMLIVIGLVAGIVITAIINLIIAKKNATKVKDLIENSKKEAEKQKKDLLLEAKEESYKLKLEAEKEIKEKKNEIKETENRLIHREQSMDRRDEMFQKRESLLDEREEKLQDKVLKIQNDQAEVDKLKQEQINELAKISGLDKEKAKDLIMKKVEEDISNEISIYIKEREDEAKLTADKTAKEMLVNSMQKYSSEVANEQTVSTIELPNN